MRRPALAASVHVMARANEHLPATAGLFLTHLVGAGQDGFTLVRNSVSG